MKAVVIPSLARAAQALTIVYGMILVVLAVIPPVEAPGIGLSDWVLHAIAYGAFGGLLLASGLGMVEVVVGTAGFGLATEVLQMLIPYRSFELLDVVADAVGALIIVLVGLFVLKIAGRPRRGRP